jgi:hypothetical protein
VAIAAEELKRLAIDAYGGQQSQLRDTAVKQLLRLAEAADDLGDLELISAFTDTVLGAQGEAGALAVEFIDFIAGQPGVNPIDAAEYLGRASRRGRLLETVYHRPAKTEAKALAKGIDPATARQMALDELRRLGDTDVLVAGRKAENLAMTENTNIGGFSRVPDPSACSFCWLIAERVYKSGELAPSHAFCKCSIDPITVDRVGWANRVGSVNLDYAGGVLSEGVVGPQGPRTRRAGEAPDE